MGYFKKNHDSVPYFVHQHLDLKSALEKAKGKPRVYEQLRERQDLLHRSFSETLNHLLSLKHPDTPILVIEMWVAEIVLDKLVQVRRDHYARGEYLEPNFEDVVRILNISLEKEGDVAVRLQWSIDRI
jgi:hypothetical protein